MTWFNLLSTTSNVGFMSGCGRHELVQGNQASIMVLQISFPKIERQFL